MKTVRLAEQKTAAQIGQYSFIAQLGHPSAHAKAPDQRAQVSDDILRLLKACQPEVIYTHNPFDKHETHIGVLLATLDAIQQLPAAKRPRQLFGCEVWRALDRLPDAKKTVHNVSAHPNLAAALNGVFVSQITSGKRYDLAVEGRRLANATFFDAHSVDNANRVHYAIDLSEVMTAEVPLEAFMRAKLSQSYPGFSYRENPSFDPIVKTLATEGKGFASARYATDAGFYGATIPVVVFGPGSIAQAHTADEWIDLAEVERAKNLLRTCILRN